METKYYYMKIPKEWLVQITFGSRLGKKYCQDIIKLLNENNYKNVTINSIQLSHDTFELSKVSYNSTLDKRIE